MAPWYRDTWRPLRLPDLPSWILTEFSKSDPDLSILKDWLRQQFRQQSPAPHVGPTEDADFSLWLSYQDWEGDLHQVLRNRRPRLSHTLFQCFASKASLIAQRHCHMCDAGLTDSERFPVSVIPIRLAPVSWQATNVARKHAFKRAIRERLNGPTVRLGTVATHCIALTFVLNTASRDKDCDNMAKGLLDALADAVGFNDKSIAHLDIVKLIFPDCEDHLTIRMAPSNLNTHADVLAPITVVSWAGAPLIKLDEA